MKGDGTASSQTHAESEEMGQLGDEKRYRICGRHPQFAAKSATNCTTIHGTRLPNSTWKRRLPGWRFSFGDRADLDQLFAAVDDMMITGSGSNVHPSLYGGDASEENGPYDPAPNQPRCLIRKATEEGWPPLAICRGLKEMNVAFGGTRATELS